MGLELSRKYILLGPFEVPKILEESGLTSNVVVRKFHNILNKINQPFEKRKNVKKLNEKKSYEGYVLEKSIKSVKFALPDIHKEINIEVSGFRFSPKQIIIYIKKLFGIVPERISGEIVLQDNILFLSIRYSSKNIYFEHTYPENYSLLKQKNINYIKIINSLLHESAIDIYEEIQPYALALYYYENEKYKICKNVIECCTKQSSKDLKSLAYKLWGDIMYHENRLDDALIKYNKAIYFNTKYSEAYVNRGNVYFINKEYKKAIDNYNIAIYYKDIVKAYYNRGCAYLEENEYNLAIDDYTYVINENPDSFMEFNVLINRAYAYYKKGEYKNAINDYTCSITINPDAYQVYYNRGVAYKNDKEYKQAINDFTSAIRLNSQYALAYNNRAWIYATCELLNIRNWKKAIMDAKRAVKLDQKNPIFYDTLAAAFAEAGKFDKAVNAEIEADKLSGHKNKTFKKLIKCYNSHRTYAQCK